MSGIDKLIGVGLALGILALITEKKDKSRTTATKTPIADVGSQTKEAATTQEIENKNASAQPTKTPKPAGNAHVTDKPAEVVPKDRKVNTQSVREDKDVQSVIDRNPLVPEEEGNVYL